MSDLDDTEFILRTAEKTEKFVCDQIKTVLTENRKLSERVKKAESDLQKVKTELKLLSNDNAQLREQVEGTESCGDTIKKVFIAGLATLDKEIDRKDNISGRATPIGQKSTKDDTPLYVATPLPTTFRQALKRKLPPDFQ